MNITALMTHVSRHLHTIVRRYSKKGELLEQVCGRRAICKKTPSMEKERLDPANGRQEPSESHFPMAKEWQDYIRQYPEIEMNLLHSDENGRPKISADENAVAYMTISTEESLFLIGPVSLAGEKGCWHSLPAQGYGPSWLLTLYNCNFMEFVTEALILHNLFHEDPLSPKEVAAYHCLTIADQFEVQRNFTHITFENQENATKHNPYDQEIREFSSIRNGDLEQLERSIQEDYIGTIGTLANTPLRNLQNLGIVLVTLACRAAMEGGVAPEVAYSLSDSYIQRIEEIRIPEAARQLAIQAEYQYASLVQEVKQKKKGMPEKGQNDPRIAQCKDYIFTHLHGKLSTVEIAKALSLNANFLSNLFKKKEGITISEYILGEKIKLVKNMLVYSPYSYSAIAAYFGFCSQSHLGKQFKKITGMTLREYREAFEMRELL